jgi:chromosome segregation ATPase
MIESLIYFGIGFLAAALMGLLFVPLVHNRAVRLTMRRLEAATPLSIAEIRADKDQLRAEFAMSTRRLEMSVEQMKAKTTAQLAELGKKSDAINQLRKELGEKTSEIFALEARDKSLRDQLRTTEEEFELKSSSLREADRLLAEKEAALTQMYEKFGDPSLGAEDQRVEFASLRTQVEAMKVTVADHEITAKEAEAKLAREREDAEAATTDLTEAREKLVSLNEKTIDLERQLIVQTTETDLLSRRTKELETLLNDQARLIAERDVELGQLRTEVETARKVESDLRSELTAANGRGDAEVGKYRSEAQLAAANEERSRLQRDVATMKQQTEAAWAEERVENAMLRERINDVAAEVSRLTAVLEGPNSPILTILADAPPLADGAASSNGETRTNGVHTADSGKSTLADRIRALQASASRVTPPN